MKDELLIALGNAIDAITNQIDGDMENYPELSKANDELYYHWKRLKYGSDVSEN